MLAFANVVVYNYQYMLDPKARPPLPSVTRSLATARCETCPYFLARHMLAFANVVVYNYQYMLDPKARPPSPVFPVHELCVRCEACQ